MAFDWWERNQSPIKRMEIGMPLYNVTVTLETLIVVVADDIDHAYKIANENTRDAIDNERPDPDVNVRGEVTSERHLHGGWDGMCVPYGGDGNTRISALLHNPGAHPVHVSLRPLTR